MANYVPSALATAQAKLFAAFEASEMKFRTPVTHMEYVQNTDVMIPSYLQLRTREDRTVTAYFKNRTSRALGSGRVHNHTGAKSDSTAFTPTWLTNSDVFNISAKQADNNIYALNEMLAHELENTLINMIEGMDTDAEAHLFANRTAVNAATQQGAFDVVDDVFNITESTEGDRAFQITQTVLDTNGHSGGFTVFCDSIAFDKFEKQRFQGAGNSDNLSFQFGKGKFVHSLGLGALAAALTVGRTKGFWIAVVDGTISSMPWIPQQNRQGVSTKENEWGTVINPIDSISYATHSYVERSDQSAAGGSAQDVNTEWEISLDVALDNAPLTTAGETTLLAFALI